MEDSLICEICNNSTDLVTIEHIDGRGQAINIDHSEHEICRTCLSDIFDVNETCPFWSE